MKVAEYNSEFLQTLDWDKVLQDVSILDGKAKVTITVNEQDGKIAKISANTYALPGTVFAGLSVSYKEEKNVPVYSLALDIFNKNEVWEVVKTAIVQFNSSNAARE